MTKSELIERISETLKLPNGKAEQIVNCVFDSMVKALQEGDGIEIRGFGSFTVREYKSYEGRNPRTGDTVHVDPKRLPFFKVGKDLRDRVNRGRPTKAQPPPPDRTVRDGGTRPSPVPDEPAARPEPQAARPEPQAARPEPQAARPEPQAARPEQPVPPEPAARPPDPMVRPSAVPLPPLGDHLQGAPSTGSAVPADPLPSHEFPRPSSSSDNASGSD